MLACSLLLAAACATSFAAPREAADKIVVNKSKREMLLLRGQTVIRSYRVALGRNPKGRKEIEGDGRTPEGSYRIDGKYAKSDYHMALRVSYPNATDRERARKLGHSAGGDIMIHGLPNGYGAVGAAHRLHDWTEGCIAVTNEEIEEIWRLVSNGTPIQINP
jgi:murein L,D-transpeptidase YafK